MGGLVGALAASRLRAAAAGWTSATSISSAPAAAAQRRLFMMGYD